MRRLALLAILVFAGCGSGDPAPGDRAAAPVTTPAPDCHPSVVHHTPYPGADERMFGIPWIAGEPRTDGLVAVLWYWNDRWGKSRTAWIFTRGVAPEGYAAKVLWAFIAPESRDQGGAELIVEGRKLDGPGTFRDTFAAISYEGQNGAPSYASIIDLPTPGCWRLTAKTDDLEGTVDVRAVRLPPRA